MKRDSGAQPHQVAVAVALVRRGDSFLVGKRRGDQVLPGQAEFPGGKCLPGEAPEECVVRECREETGLEVRVLARRQEVIHDYPHGRVRLTFLDCESCSSSEPIPPFHWVPRQQLAALHFPEANRGVIDQLLACQ